MAFRRDPTKEKAEGVYRVSRGKSLELISCYFFAECAGSDIFLIGYLTFIDMWMRTILVIWYMDSSDLNDIVYVRVKFLFWKL